MIFKENYKIKTIFLFLFVCISTNGQKLYDEHKNLITNKHVLTSFFNKLNNNESVSIVHIGDSHIQANFFSGHLRELFQNKYGTSSRGITFPLRLAKTHGHTDIKYYSNIEWDNVKIIDEKNDFVGISGATIQTKSPKFFIKIVNKNDLEINQIKIIGKGLEKLKFGKSKVALTNPKAIFSSIVYKVKSGDYLIKIARKFKTSVAKLKKWNKLKSDDLKINQKLKVKKKSAPEQVKINMDNFNLIPVTYQSDNEVILNLDFNLDDLYIISNENTSSETKIDAVFVNNNTKGVTYHSIGINGAKFSDYNTSKLFFDQLHYTKPDLVIVSLGTNSSFDKNYQKDFFLNDAQTFLNSIKESTSCEAILVTTPPSSMFRKKYKNPNVEKFSSILKEISLQNNYASWDLLSIMGVHNIKFWYNKKLAAKDKIHYTKKGYELQANLLFKALNND